MHDSKRLRSRWLQLSLLLLPLLVIQTVPAGLRSERGDTPAAKMGAGATGRHTTRERLEAELAAERATVAELRKQLSERDTAARTTIFVDRSWQSPRYILAGLALTFLIGMLIGNWLMDYRQRRRHGGFRV